MENRGKHAIFLEKKKYEKNINFIDSTMELARRGGG